MKLSHIRSLTCVAEHWHENGAFWNTGLCLNCSGSGEHHCRGLEDSHFRVCYQRYKVELLESINFRNKVRLLLFIDISSSSPRPASTARDR